MSRPVPDGVLLLDKPAGITSTRALAMARRALGAARAGHTGTLDPFATGLLPLVFGEATKFSRFLIDSTKGYVATLRLGEESETGDPESPARRVTDVMPESAEIAAVCRRFVGDIDQLPPMHSAVHVNGRRLYEYAREGRTIARELRQVHVFKLEIQALRGADLTLDVTCSKGTYIRVLAADIGRALGCGAYLTALRRTTVGDFTLEHASSLEDLAAIGPEEAQRRLLPVHVLVSGLGRVDLDGDAAQRFVHGQVIATEDLRHEGPVALFEASRGFLGVGTRSGDRITPLRLMAQPVKSPDFP